MKNVIFLVYYFIKFFKMEKIKNYCLNKRVVMPDFF